MSFLFRDLPVDHRYLAEVCVARDSHEMRQGNFLPRQPDPLPIEIAEFLHNRLKRLAVELHKIGMVRIEVPNQMLVVRLLELTNYRLNRNLAFFQQGDEFNKAISLTL